MPGACLRNLVALCPYASASSIVCHTHHGSQLSVSLPNTGANQLLKRKGWFGLTVWRSQSLVGPAALGKAMHHGRCVRQNQPLHE